jgi:aryl-alcohol dehydrogenase-like predicted oxidoreductase
MNWYKYLKFSQKIKMPTRKLGKTGHNVSIFSLGGQGSLELQGGEKNCINIIKRAYELGVNYFDTSPIYGPSEDYYGKALKGIRNKIFLATKTDKRDRDGSLKEIEKSLKRLKTDYIDLWQIHHLDKMNEVNEVTKKDGALQALIEMKEQGVVKNIGITGHEDTNILLEVMKRYDFDTVLCPVNACDVNMKKSFIKTVVKEANNKNMGIIGMKVFSQGYIFHPKGITNTWEALNYALSQLINTVIVGCDTVEQLEENVSIAKSFQPLDKKILNDITSKTEKYKRRASFFRSEYGGYKSRDKLSEPFVLQNMGIK